MAAFVVVPETDLANDNSGQVVTIINADTSSALISRGKLPASSESEFVANDNTGNLVAIINADTSSAVIANGRVQGLVNLGTSAFTGYPLHAADINYDATLAADGNALGLNLAHSNTWTAQQTFGEGIVVGGGSGYQATFNTQGASFQGATNWPVYSAATQFAMGEPGAAGSWSFGTQNANQTAFVERVRFGGNAAQGAAGITFYEPIEIVNSYVTLGYNMNGTDGSQIVAWNDNAQNYGVALVENNNQGGLAIVNKGTSTYYGLNAGTYTVPLFCGPSGYVATQAVMNTAIGTNVGYSPRNILDDGSGNTTITGLITANAGVSVPAGQSYGGGGSLGIGGLGSFGGTLYAKGLITAGGGITGTGSTGTLTAGTGILGTSNTFTAGQTFNATTVTNAGNGTSQGLGDVGRAIVVGGNLNGATSFSNNQPFIGWNLSGGDAELDVVAQDSLATGVNTALQVRTLTGTASPYGVSGVLFGVGRDGQVNTANNTLDDGSGNMTPGGNLTITSGKNLYLSGASGDTQLTQSGSGVTVQGIEATLLSAQISGSPAVFALDTSGDLGISGALYAASVSASTLKSTAPAGTAPLSVASTTQVANLNASMVGGWGIGSLSAALTSTTAGTTAGDVFITSFFLANSSGYPAIQVVYLNNYENDTATDQTVSWPKTFANYAYAVANSTGLAISASTTGLTITTPDSTSPFTGMIMVIGA